jgi:Dehydratase family
LFAPDDVAADHAGLVAVTGVVGAVEGEVAQYGELRLDAIALGVQLPGSAAIPAVDARRYALAQLAGRRIVEMVREDLRLSRVLTREAFENAIRVNAAIGGSTNAVLHLLAIAGRAGVSLSLNDFNTLAEGVPWLVNLQPSGRFLMEDFFYAGGLAAVMSEITRLLNLDALTVTGRTVRDNIADLTRLPGTEVIAPASHPLAVGAGTAVLRGNLCPDGAIIKQSATPPPGTAPQPGPGLREHRGVQHACRRSTPARRREHHPCAQARRAARLPRHARSRQPRTAP